MGARVRQRPGRSIKAGSLGGDRTSLDTPRHFSLDSGLPPSYKGQHSSSSLPIVVVMTRVELRCNVGGDHTFVAQDHPWHCHCTQHMGGVRAELLQGWLILNPLEPPPQDCTEGAAYQTLVWKPQRCLFTELLVCFWATPSAAWGLSWALCSRITPDGGPWEPLC